MRIEIKNGGIVGADDCAYYEIYSIDIDKSNKTLELNDEWGYVRGLIHYKNFEEIEYINYEGEEIISKNSTIIIKNGKVVI